MIRNLLPKILALYRGIPSGVLIRLLAAPFLLSLVDLSVTLYFQPEAYWNGDRSVVVEGNPLARLAFSIHPLLIIPGLIGWYALVIPLICTTPAWVGLRIHVFLVLGHLIMIAGWLMRNSGQGLILTAIIWGVAIPAAWLLFAPYRKWWDMQECIRSFRSAR